MRAFRTLFAKSPVKRIGRDRFVRNVLVAIGNSGDAALADAAKPLLDDPSPLVAEMAAWALEELQNSDYIKGEEIFMADIVIYTKDYCPYCVKAKGLLTRKGKPFREIDITHDENLQKEMVEKSGGRKTVPQIFINGKSVGGCDDLYALDGAGKLDALYLSPKNSRHSVAFMQQYQIF